MNHQKKPGYKRNLLFKKIKVSFNSFISDWFGDISILDILKKLIVFLFLGLTVYIIFFLINDYQKKQNYMYQQQRLLERELRLEEEQQRREEEQQRLEEEQQIRLEIQIREEKQRLEEEQKDVLVFTESDKPIKEDLNSLGIKLVETTNGIEISTFYNAGVREFSKFILKVIPKKVGDIESLGRMIAFCYMDKVKIFDYISNIFTSLNI